MPVVYVRFPGEAHDVRSFVTPGHPDVTALASALRHDARNCYDWVVYNITYPPLSRAHLDYHRIQMFPREGLFAGYLLDLSTQEYWEFPAESLGWKDPIGRRFSDCDGMSILLCSLLRTFTPGRQVYVAVGELEGAGGHAWVRFLHDNEWHVLEPTLDRPFPLWALVEKSPYVLQAYFNDVEAVEVVPGTWGTLGSRQKSPRSTHRVLSGLRHLAMEALHVA